MELIVVGAIIGGIWLIYCLVRSAAKASDHVREPKWFPRPQTVLQPPPSFLGGSNPQPPRQIAPGAANTIGIARWVPNGEEVELQGIRISGGFFYVGSVLSKVRGYGVEPALIDPCLPVQASGSGEDLPYWTSYSDISSSSRGAYLRWLSEGRCDPNAPLGLVFLFFYGLERRILADMSQVSGTEREQIREEVGRLLGIYGHGESFRRYANGLLGILRAATIDSDHLADNPPDVTKSYESPNLLLRMGLGWMANNARPMPSTWALAWVKSHDAFYERTPATRCKDQFERLFAIRYRGQFGEGVIVKPNKTTLQASYKPASSSFPGAVEVTVPALPDITILRQPIERLIVLANQCLDDLDPYSRYVGRNPVAGESVAALTLLPAELIQHGGHPTLERIAVWIRSLPFTNGLTLATFRDLREVWSSLPVTGITKRDAVMFSQCLARLGYGVEPDIRFSSHQVRADGQIVLFALPDDAPVAPSAPYTSSTLLAHLGAVMAHADNQVTPEEERALMSHAAQTLDLSEAERLRLRAYMKWLLTTRPETTGLKKRIEALPAERRSLLGSFLARLVGLDGQITPAEITALQKVYRQLGLDPKSVFTDTHSAVTEPVSMQPAQPVPGFAIPIPNTGTRKLRINMDRIRAMEVESDQVSVLLRDIFTSDDGEIITAATVSESSLVFQIRVLDLDEAHSRFTLALIARDFWSRVDLEAIASQYRLMPDGAIDAVNEAALNLHGEPLLEGDDPVEVNPQLRSVIQP